MRTISTRILYGAALAIALSVASVMAEDYRFGTLEILSPNARATAPMAKVAGGYLTIVNHSAQADRLIGGSADFAGKVEVHEMRMDGDTMVMRPVDDGLEIAPGATVELKPGGYHIMFMQLGEQLKPDERRAVRLRFERAGEVEVEFKVEAMGGHATN